MAIKAVLFDLDGTLLPMDQDVFMKYYFGGLAKRLAPYGYEPKPLIDAVWAGSVAMVKNDGSRTNESVFWDKFAEILGEGIRAHEKELEDFYRNEFSAAKAACEENPMARKIIDRLKEKGISVVLATNPLFPSVATEARMSWIGLNKEDFLLVTTYENSGSCKPNPQYYREILEKIGYAPEDCLMVGNDVDEDMIAETLGMKVFLVTDCLLNRKGKDISRYPSGDFDALLRYLDEVV